MAQEMRWWQIAPAAGAFVDAYYAPVFLVLFGLLLSVAAAVDLVERDFGSWMASTILGLMGLYLIRAVAASRPRLGSWRTWVAVTVSWTLPIAWVLRTFDPFNATLRWSIDAYWLVVGGLSVALALDIRRRERPKRRRATFEVVER